MAEVTAKLRYARISPQKCRLVADTVRGAKAGNALSTLKYMPKKGAKLVYKVLWSAVENARENAGLDVDDLKVSRIHVDAAPMFKRFAARAKGRGARIIKRNSHITVAVSDGKKD
jgi:large subunit ribosomal protein L22